MMATNTEVQRWLDEITAIDKEIGPEGVLMARRTKLASQVVDAAKGLAAQVGVNLTVSEGPEGRKSFIGWESADDGQYGTIEFFRWTLDPETMEVDCDHLETMPSTLESVRLAPSIVRRPEAEVQG